MSRVCITSSDPIHYYVYDESEAIDMFGEDCIEDLVEIPTELLNRYKKAYSEFWEVQEELERYYK